MRGEGEPFVGMGCVLLLRLVGFIEYRKPPASGLRPSIRGIAAWDG
jgi:hypothetical protein